MSGRARWDAVVVGSGPNGLAAAISLALAGHSVVVFEAQPTIGGGARSAELTLPGVVHDVCSAAHPLAVSSPFFHTLFDAHGPAAGLAPEWVYSPAAVAHPFDDGTAAVLERSPRAAGETLGPDGAAYERLMAPLAGSWSELTPDLLGPLPLPPHHPLTLARFGVQAIRSAAGLARSAFSGERARGVFAGLAAHSMLRLEQPLSAAFGLVLGASAHAVGWPIARGGSQRIADALAACLRGLGGEIVAGRPIVSLADLPPSGVVLLDLTPRQVLDIAGARLPAGYRCALARFRYGLGVFKLDWALDGPIPWRAAGCLRAATVHLGSTLAEIAASERAAWQGHPAEPPYVLLGQPSLFDPSRAPAGVHTAWAYCHVPAGSPFDMTERVEAQVERYAPGFRDRILARSVMSPAEIERHNANYIGGDIAGGVQDWRQQYTRPVARLVPYSTPVDGLFLCSSSTPPGAGVHGMCGYHAARAALRYLRSR